VLRDYFFVGLGDGLCAGVAVLAGEATVGCRSLGLTWPITGRCWPKLRMIGTDLELWSCGDRKSV
jgi:hypothetical protein